jgi:hypothetical protein
LLNLGAQRCSFATLRRLSKLPPKKDGDLAACSKEQVALVGI